MKGSERVQERYTLPKPSADSMTEEGSELEDAISLCLQSRKSQNGTTYVRDGKGALCAVLV